MLEFLCSSCGKPSTQQRMDFRRANMQQVGYRARIVAIPCQVRLFGKGRKERVCPLWPQTAALLRALCAERQLALRAAVPIFVNQRGQPLSRFGVCYILAKYLKRAQATVPSLTGQHLHPHSQTIDFLLTEQRDEEAALRFLKKAIRRHGVPEKNPIDESAANEAAIKSYNAEHGTAIAIRKVKYLNNIVEQDHRAMKRVTRPMLGFKSFDAARGTMVGIELLHMIKKKTAES